MSSNRPANTFRNTPRSAPARRGTSRSGSFRSLVGQRPLLQRLYRFVFRLFLYAFLFSVGWVVVLKFVPIWFTPLMLSRKIDALSEGTSTKVYKTWKSYDEISKEAALAVVASEDQAFPYHWGFDFDEIQDAIKENQHRKRPRGASTITQQVAKNVFLWTGRSYLRKGLEVYFTLMIELIWGKKRILEVYLNVAETGPMTFGVEAASQRFYGHSAQTLSRSEAARMAAVLPNPRQFSIANPSNYIQRRSRQITRQMRALGGQAYIKKL